MFCFAHHFNTCLRYQELSFHLKYHTVYPSRQWYDRRLILMYWVRHCLQWYPPRQMPAPQPVMAASMVALSVTSSLQKPYRLSKCFLEFRLARPCKRLLHWLSLMITQALLLQIFGNSLLIPPALPVTSAIRPLSDFGLGIRCNFAFLPAASIRVECFLAWQWSVFRNRFGAFHYIDGIDIKFCATPGVCLSFAKVPCPHRDIRSPRGWHHAWPDCSMLTGVIIICIHFTVCFNTG